MGSSAKRKKEKQKDFQKTKLRVGKTKPKPDNYTETSFQSKGIVLKSQSTTTPLSTPEAQFSHSLSLLSSKSDAQRRDSLAHLSSLITSRPVDSPLPQPVTVILPSILPLILDVSNGVRSNLLRLLRALPPSDMEGHISKFLPYVRAGMTHLAANIRLSSVEILSYLVGLRGREEVVCCAGGWTRTLDCFLSVLGWHAPVASKTGPVSTAAMAAVAAATPTAPPGSRKDDKAVGAKLMTRALQTLGDFLKAGVLSDGGNGGDKANREGDLAVASPHFPLRDLSYHLLPSRNAPYAHLNLYGQVTDDENGIHETSEDRVRVLKERYLAAVERGVTAAKREGGEMARATAAANVVLREINRSA